MHGFGKDVIAWRKYYAKLHVSDNPFGANDVDEVKNILLLEKDDTTLEFKEVIDFSGILYAERLQVWAKWDIFTPDPRSQKVIMRHSYKVVWLN